MTTTRRTHRRRRCQTHPTPTTPRYRPRTSRPTNTNTNNDRTDVPHPVPAGAEWLTPNQAATYLQVPARQLQQWRYLKKGPPYSLAGRAVRYRRTDLDAWLTAHRVEPEDTGR